MNNYVITGIVLFLVAVGVVVWGFLTDWWSSTSNNDSASAPTAPPFSNTGVKCTCDIIEHIATGTVYNDVNGNPVSVAPHDITVDLVCQTNGLAAAADLDSYVKCGCQGLAVVDCGVNATTKSTTKISTGDTDHPDAVTALAAISADPKMWSTTDISGKVIQVKQSGSGNNDGIHRQVVYQQVDKGGMGLDNNAIPV